MTATAGRICWSPTIPSPTSFIATSSNGTFEDVAVQAGMAFSDDGKARAGMGVDVADFDNSGMAGVAITNFDNEMIGLYRRSQRQSTRHRHASGNRARLAQHLWASDAASWMSNLDG